MITKRTFQKCVKKQQISGLVLH